MNILLSALIVLLSAAMVFAIITMAVLLYGTFKAIRDERPTSCKWRNNARDCSEYQTGCGETFHNANDGNPVTDWAAFCPYCGGKIK